AETRIARELRSGRTLYHRYGYDELVFVIEHPSPEEQRPPLELVVQRCGELAAAIRGEGRRAYAHGFAVEAADRAVPTLSDFEAGVGVEAVHALVAVGHANRTGRLLSAALENEVGGGSHLSRTVQGARSAHDDLGALYGVVETEQRARVHERERGHAV